MEVFQLDFPEFREVERARFLGESLAAMVTMFTCVWVESALGLKLIPRQFSMDASLCLTFFLQRVLPDCEERDIFWERLSAYGQAVGRGGAMGQLSSKCIAREWCRRTVGQPRLSADAATRMEEELSALANVMLLDISRYEILAEGDPQDLLAAPLAQWDHVRVKNAAAAGIEEDSEDSRQAKSVQQVMGSDPVHTRRTSSGWLTWFREPRADVEHCVSTSKTDGTTWETVVLRVELNRASYPWELLSTKRGATWGEAKQNHREGCELVRNL